MRKAVMILAVLAFVPVAAFAEWGVGAVAFIKPPVSIGQPTDIDKLNFQQISFGGDLRLKLGWFQAEALVLYWGGDVDSIRAYLDVGLALDAWALRLSLGAGPNFTYNLGAGPLTQTGLNAKIGADIKLGAISFGASYIMALSVADGFDVQTGAGLFGVEVIFWM